MVKMVYKNLGLTPPSKALYQFDISVPAPYPKKVRSPGMRALPYRCIHYTRLKLSVGQPGHWKLKILIHCAQLFYLENKENSTSPLGEKRVE